MKIVNANVSVFLLVQGLVDVDLEISKLKKKKEDLQRWVERVCSAWVTIITALLVNLPGIFRETGSRMLSQHLWAQLVTQKLQSPCSKRTLQNWLSCLRKLRLLRRLLPISRH